MPKQTVNAQTLEISNGLSSKTNMVAVITKGKRLGTTEIRPIRNER